MITSPRTTDSLPVAIIGAGPVGLAAAAHLAVRGLPFVVFERGPTPATAMAEWGHVTFFSPWRYVVDDAARRLLEGTGWSMPDPDRDPTGRELIDDYLVPLASHPAIAPNLRCDARVVSVTRLGDGSRAVEGARGAAVRDRRRRIRRPRGAASGARRHRCVGNLEQSEPGRRQRRRSRSANGPRRPVSATASPTCSERSGNASPAAA